MLDVMRHSDSSLLQPLRRRQLAALATSAVTAPVAARLLAGAPTTAAPAAAPGSRLQLRRDPDSVVSALDVPVPGAAPGAMRSAPGAVRTPVMETTRFTLLGVTWRAGRARVRARVRRIGGGWTRWQELEPLHDGPDLGSAEARRTPRATAPTWVGPSDAVQLEVAGSPDEPVLALVDGGRKASDAAPPPRALARSVAARVRRAPAPAMRSPRVWGANPTWRDGTSRTNNTLKQVHLHHTASSNDYSRADVPAIIRSVYRYHTKSLGWSDLGYNFLVDRFGRIWVGRRGSRSRLVRGAHTLGFNHASMGIAVIGNFEVKRPSDRAVSSIVRLAAWRLDWYDRDPRGWIALRSHGSDRYAEGRRVRLPVIDGHRDTNDTACPGTYLYAELPDIRLRTARRIRRYQTLQRVTRR